MTKKHTLAGRKHEQAILYQVLQTKKAEFVAIYGRRRVGKTYLVRKAFQTTACLFFNVTGIYKGSMQTQLKEFSRELGRTFLHGTAIKENSNWFDAFALLTEIMQKHVPKNKKIVLFFDEFPWMVTPRSQLLQALDYYWNQHWSQDSRVKLIVCGSSASWIITHIINQKGGLHNRLTQSILLEPMTLKESKEMLSLMGIKLKHAQIVELYMAMGGIPFYLSQISKGLSATQVIDKLAFTKNSLFLEEFDKLYAALFEDSDSYIEIVRAIADHRYGISQTELFKKCHGFSKGGTVTNKLTALEDAGFIISFKPFHHKKKGLFYKVIDEYTLFYFHWIEPIKQTLAKKGLRKGYWDSIKKTAGYSSWSGYAFEAICYKHLHQISEALNLRPTALPGTWQYKPKPGSKDQGTQIDLLFDRDDDAMTICEIKYSTKPFAIDKDYAHKIDQKFQIFETRIKTKKQLFFAMITSNGLKKTLYSEDMVDDVITVDQLFRS